MKLGLVLLWKFDRAGLYGTDSIVVDIYFKKIKQVCRLAQSRRPIPPINHLWVRLTRDSAVLHCYCASATEYCASASGFEVQSVRRWKIVQNGQKQKWK